MPRPTGVSERTVQFGIISVAKVSHEVDHTVAWRLEDWHRAGAPGGQWWHAFSPTANPLRKPVNFPLRHELIVVDSDRFIRTVLLSRRWNPAKSRRHRFLEYRKLQIHLRLYLLGNECKETKRTGCTHSHTFSKAKTNQRYRHTFDY